MTDVVVIARHELAALQAENKRLREDAEQWRKHGKKMKFHFEEIRDGEYANHPLSLQAIAAEIIDAIDAAKGKE